MNLAAKLIKTKATTPVVAFLYIRENPWQKS